MPRMNWDKLLTKKRVTDIECRTPSTPSNFKDPRSPFERDCDQITFSYPFRRLQDKTQVIPFPKFDFVHTRLTHSLEVASVGRSFGKLVAPLIFEEMSNETKEDLELCPSDIGALIGAACLAHDIGNPPFGHSGEDSISHYFLNNRHDILKPQHTLVEGTYYGYQPDENGEYVRGTISDADAVKAEKRYRDLSSFEGNANGFRIMTQNCDKGINPTLSLLGTFTKYPRESFLQINPFAGATSVPKSQSKYGFFNAQKDLFKKMADELGLIPIDGTSPHDIAYRRHPLAFLMEASDDIAYAMIDFEDGCRLGLIDFEKHYSKIKLRKKNNTPEEVEINKSPKEILIEIAQIDTSFSLDRLGELEDYKDAISYLRGKVINVLIHECYKVFKENYEGIMKGTFDKALIENIQNPGIKDNLSLMTTLVRKFVYQYSPVLESEATGFEVMEHLIDAFAVTSNICYSCGSQETAKDRKLRSLLPEDFQPETEVNLETLSDDEKYDRILRVLDYISGMTDKFAVSLYRKIKGIEI